MDPVEIGLVVALGVVLVWLSGAPLPGFGSPYEGFRPLVFIRPWLSQCHKPVEE
jgi:hypothetical protein